MAENREKSYDMFIGAAVGKERYIEDECKAIAEEDRGNFAPVIVSPAGLLNIGTISHVTPVL